MEKTIEKNYYVNGQYYCTENYHRVNLGLLVTDGVKHVLDKFKCYWVGDIVSSYIPKLHKLIEDFCVVRVHVDNNTADVIIDDGNNNILIKQHIEYTDLTDNLKFFIQLNDFKGEQVYIACLPSEY